MITIEKDHIVRINGTEARMLLHPYAPFDETAACLIGLTPAEGLYADTIMMTRIRFQNERESMPFYMIGTGRTIIKEWPTLRWWRNIFDGRNVQGMTIRFIGSSIQPADWWKGENFAHGNMPPMEAKLFPIEPHLFPRGMYSTVTMVRFFIGFLLTNKRTPWTPRIDSIIQTSDETDNGRPVYIRLVPTNGMNEIHINIFSR